ncbi:DUF6177 family protein [Actinomadura oligospora]|uniref:DUF6177 family protein n=1 Tax=Actinomadura oligospora TaxID=111804 RepID=UPI00047EB5E7|nr:DUF6177 family protein [Actinomadura oligospora]
MTTFDAVTDRALVVLSDRPVIGLTSDLAEAESTCTGSGRIVQLVTSPHSRITTVLRLLVTANKIEWIVRDTDGYYAALTGHPMHWDGTAFVPLSSATDYAPGFVKGPASPLGTHLTLTLRTDSSAPGAAVEALTRAMTGANPTGWDTSEPIAHPWNLADLYADPPTRMVAVGPGPSLALSERTSAHNGTATENTTITFAFALNAPQPHRHLPAILAAAATEVPFTSLLVHQSPGRPDLTVEPRWSGTSTPVGLAITGFRPPAPDFPSAAAGPITWYPLGDTTTPATWHHYHRLLHHLQHQPEH